MPLFSCILFYILDFIYHVVEVIIIIFCFSQISSIILHQQFLPVTIRLLDPPLHEFFPESDINKIVSTLASKTGVIEDEIFSRMENISEVNPMLCFCGCKCVTIP